MAGMSNKERRFTMFSKIGPQGEWTAEMTWYGDDQHGPGLVVISATDPENRPAGGLSQTVLREIDFAEAVQDMRTSEAYYAKIPRINWETIGAKLAQLSEAGVKDGHYLAMLSNVYCTLAATDDKPVNKLAELTGKSSAAIKSHLWEATRRGLLIRSPGRRGGRMTAATMELLTGEPVPGAGT